MPLFRRKISAVNRDFNSEISRLERFDSENQRRFSLSIDSFSKNQLHFLTESIFFRAFRSYEKLVRDIFLLYCLDKRSDSGKKASSYLKPKSFWHAETLIKSQLHFLDWGNPDIVIERAETYLKDGYPIKLPLSSNRQALQDFRKIRNHIAHDSRESFDGYKSVLIKHYGTVPLSVPCPAEFLLRNDRADPSKYKLQVYFELLKDMIVGFS